MKNRFDFCRSRCRAGIVTLPALLLACATPPPVGSVSAVAKEELTAVTPPPGYELHETVLCGQEWRKGPHNTYLPPKTITLPIRTFVPKAQCLELTAEGQLRAVPGDCSTPPSKVTSCN